MPMALISNLNAPRIMRQSHLGINIRPLRKSGGVARHLMGTMLFSVAFVAVAAVANVSAGDEKSSLTTDQMTVDLPPIDPQRSLPPAWLKRLEELHGSIKPQSDESQYAQIPWMSSIAEARNKAAEEGKPIFIWYMVGEPLGQC